LADTIEKTTERTLRLPGDKSISHRYAMLGAMAQGASRFQNFSTGADCGSSLDCMRQLGAEVTRSGDTVEIEGCGGTLTPPGGLLDCGNSGSTMRMLSGLLAAQPGAFTLEGDASLNRRPMERVRKPLLEMGAVIHLVDGRQSKFKERSCAGSSTGHRCPARRSKPLCCLPACKPRARLR
jgi:3-phosphoshikimate 1-carboxyvinyltransferase